MELPERIRAALLEDVGEGDLTTRLLVQPHLQGRARVWAKAAGVLSGFDPFREVFKQLESLLTPLDQGGARRTGRSEGHQWPAIALVEHFKDGSMISTGEVIIELSGPLAPILTGERTALNFLQRLSGMATLTRKYIEAVRDTGAIILDTRKTTPLWRDLEKAAVRHGGGSNHRFGLYDMILIKENHQTAAGGIAEAIQQVKQAIMQYGSGGFPPALPGSKAPLIEVEIQSLAQLNEILPLDVDRIMLDNFSPEDVRRAVALVKGGSCCVPLEVSGGVTLENVREYALTGVNFISVGALTHSAPALDLSLIVEP